MRTFLKAVAEAVYEIGFVSNEKIPSKMILIRYFFYITKKEKES